MILNTSFSLINHNTNYQKNRLYLRKALIDLQKNVQQENQAFCFRKIQLSQFLS